MRKTKDSAIKKMERLGLEVDGARHQVSPTTSRLCLPKSLPSVEEALRILVGARFNPNQTNDVAKSVRCEMVRYR